MRFEDTWPCSWFGRVTDLCRLCLPVVSCVEFHSHHFMKSDSEYRTPRTAPGAIALQWQAWNRNLIQAISIRGLVGTGQETPPFEELSWTDLGVPWDAVLGSWSQRQQ